jgi:hypothetical protein
MIYVSTNFANRKKERVLDHQKYGQQQEEDRTGVSRRRPVVI